MLNFINFRTILITSVVVVNTYIFSLSIYEYFTHSANLPLNEEGLYGFSIPITDLFFENVDPFLQELHSYNYNPYLPNSYDLWTTQDVIEEAIRIIPTHLDLYLNIRPPRSTLLDLYENMGDKRLYIKIQDFPLNLNPTIERLREVIINRLIDFDINIGYDYNEILIKYPLEGNTIKFLVKTQLLDQSQFPLHEFFMIIVR